MWRRLAAVGSSGRHFIAARCDGGGPAMVGSGGLAWRGLVDNAVLNSALEKIRGSDTVPTLVAEELKALSGYLSHTASKEARTESEELLCRHIRAVLHEQAVAGRQAGAQVPQCRRANTALRATIDPVSAAGVCGGGRFATGTSSGNAGAAGRDGAHSAAHSERHAAGDAYPGVSGILRGLACGGKVGVAIPAGTVRGDLQLLPL